MSTTSRSLEKYVQGIPWKSRKVMLIKLSRLRNDMVSWTSGTGFRNLFCSNVFFSSKSSAYQISRKTFTATVSLGNSSLTESENLSDDEEASETCSENPLSKPLTSDELKSLIADTERTKLIKKLSEANQHNRFLKRQMHDKEDALVNLKSDIAVMELEIQALAAMAEEIAKYGIPEGSRKIKGKYIQSHLLYRLRAVHEKLKEQVKNANAAQSKKVSLFWSGMAESVEVMGSFDGWSQGEHLSPEYTGSFSRFSTTLILRPGRYEIKFLVDGEWKLSPEFPTVGEGLMKNNLLVVE